MRDNRVHFGDLPPKPNKPARGLPRANKSDENYTLLARAKAGDVAAREQLIIGNMRLVASLAWKYVQGKSPYGHDLRGYGDGDDIFSEGLVGLTSGVNGLLKLESVDDLGEYLSDSICNEINRAIEDRFDEIGIAESGPKGEKGRTIPFDRLKVGEGALFCEGGDDDDGYEPTYEHRVTAEDCLRVIDRVAECEADKLILELRLHGLTHDKIVAATAGTLDRGKTWIGARLTYLGGKIRRLKDQDDAIAALLKRVKDNLSGNS